MNSYGIPMKQVKLSFDPIPHKYTDDEGNVYTSATTLIGHVTPTFQQKYWAMYRALEQSFYEVRMDKKFQSIYIKVGEPPFDEWEPFDIDSLYGGAVRLNRSIEEVLIEWQELCKVACDWGTERHNYLEDCINRFYKANPNIDANDVPDMIKIEGNQARYRYRIISKTELNKSPLSASHPKIYGILLGLINKGYTLYAEKRVYSYHHLVSGTIDVLAVKGRDFIIVDWKTNKDELEFKSGYYKKVWANETRTHKIKTKNFVNTNEKFLFPVSSIPLCKGNGYAIQLSIYAYLCELWGYKCKGLIICHIRHKEKLNYKDINITLVPEINKTEIAPKIYPNITYHRDEIHKLLDWHRTVNILKEPYQIERKAVFVD